MSFVVIFFFILAANGIYQSSVFGMAASLPPKYTGAVVLGCNLCGVLTTLVSIASNAFTDNKRAAAIYYFITALFILLICFDTYFALPLNVSLFIIYFRAISTLSIAPQFLQPRLGFTLVEATW